MPPSPSPPQPLLRPLLSFLRCSQRGASAGADEGPFLLAVVVAAASAVDAVVVAVAAVAVAAAAAVAVVAVVVSAVIAVDAPFAPPPPRPAPASASGISSPLASESPCLHVLRLQEVETNEEMQLLIFMELRARLGTFRTFFLWLSLNSFDMQVVHLLFLLLLFIMMMMLLLLLLILLVLVAGSPPASLRLSH